MSENSSDLEIGVGAANSHKYPFLKTLDLSLDVERRLTLHLDRLVSGDDAILVSALAKDNDPKHVLSSWNAIFDSKRPKMNQTLIDLELGNLEKFGPRSIAKPWSERISGIEDYFSDPDRKLPFDANPALMTARGRLRPLSVESALKVLKNNTNSGLPYYTKKGFVKERTLRKLELLLHRKDPAILFTRTQEGGKTRNVWGYPCADTLEETRYYRPVLSHQAKLSWRSALLGPDAVSKYVTLLMLKARDNGDVIISGDISAFDANAKRSLQFPAFTYLQRLFQFDYRVGLDRIFERFSNIPLLTPSGIARGPHGVPSGSTFTNEVDSIIQYIIVKSLGFDDDCIQIQGDDLLLCVPPNSVDAVKQRFKDAGLPFKEEKTVVSSEYCVYLQNLFHFDYMRNGKIGGIYPTYRALNRILYQERWSKFEEFGLTGMDYYSIRTISILENCKHHPLFEDLVKFVLDLDKYSLRFSRGSVAKFDAMLNDDSGTGGFMFNQYGDDIKGINSFETVKLLNKLRRR